MENLKHFFGNQIGGLVYYLDPIVLPASFKYQSIFCKTLIFFNSFNTYNNYSVWQRLHGLLDFKSYRFACNKKTARK